MRRALAVLVAVVAFVPGIAHAGQQISGQVCYFSGGPNHDPLNTYYTGTIAPWTGITAPAALTGPWYGSSGCAGDGYRVGIMSHACNDPACVSVSPIRTAQLIYPLTQQPFNRTWTITTNLSVTGRVSPWQTAQTLFFWFALNDTTHNKQVWYSVILWDSRGSQVYGFPGVIVDRHAGGGTDALNVLGLLAGGYSRYVTHLSGPMSGDPAPGVQTFRITPTNIAAALTDVVRVDPTFSANPNDYTVTAAAIDFEAYRFGGPIDWFAYVVNSTNIT